MALNYARAGEVSANAPVPPEAKAIVVPAKQVLPRTHWAPLSIAMLPKFLYCVPKLETVPTDAPESNSNVERLACAGVWAPSTMPPNEAPVLFRQDCPRSWKCRRRRRHRRPRRSNRN